MVDVFEILDLGMGLSVQDEGRVGWLRYGVPSSGAMDSYAAGWANRLLDNEADCSVLECCLYGVRLKVLSDCWLACCGVATGEFDWSARVVKKGELISLSPQQNGAGGVWSYLAIKGGFESPSFFGSASTYERAGIGERLKAGDVLRTSYEDSLAGSAAVNSKYVQADERRATQAAELVQVFVEKGSTWTLFSDRQKEAFFGQRWRVSAKSDRTGYRLEGDNLSGEMASIKSEPVLPGTVQITTGGCPIVTMVDGPTVGGYAKMAFLEKEERERLAQCQPGTEVQFILRRRC